MHIKFHAGGGTPATAAAYLLADRDGGGQRRAAVEVLRGDPELVAAVAADLEFAHTYTAGVFAWSAEDAPTPEQIEEVVDEFEATAWSGLEADRYAWSAVLHRDHDGSAHVHVFAARVDLETGKSLNIAPPGWQDTYDALRNWQNYKHGWTRPDDPARRRLVEPGYGAYNDLRQALAIEKDPRTLLTDHVRAGIDRGTITNRDGVVRALGDIGLTVTRQGQHYITAADPESGGRWRLKGMIYEQDFKTNSEQFKRERAGQDRERAEPDRGGDDTRAREARSALEAHRERRREYHRTRYPTRAAPALGKPAYRGPDALARVLRRELGSDAILHQPGDDTPAQNRHVEDSGSEDPTPSMRGEAVREDRSERTGISKRLSDLEGVLNDRARRTLVEELAALGAAMRRAVERSRRRAKRLARDLREYLERQRDIARERAALDRAGAALEHHARAVEQWVARRPRARERHADREPGD